MMDVVGIELLLIDTDEGDVWPEFVDEETLAVLDVATAEDCWLVVVTSCPAVVVVVGMMAVEVEIEVEEFRGADGLLVVCCCVKAVDAEEIG